MRWIGHGGLAAGLPGGAPDRQTLDQAVRLGLDMLELDVCVTADAVCVVRHDTTLASGRRLDACRLDELRRTLPDLLTLDDAVDHLSARVPVLLDLKPGATDAVGAWLRRRGGDAEVAVCTDDDEALRSLRAVAPATPLWLTLPKVGAGRGERRRRVIAAALRRRLPAALPGLAGSVGAAGLCVDHWAVTAALCRAAHRLRLPVAAWTVNRPGRARAMARCRVDLLTTDDVAGMRAALDGRR